MAVLNLAQLRLRTPRAIWFALLVVAPISLAHAVTLPPISEETPAGICPAGMGVTQIGCTGSYCDNVTLTCSAISGHIAPAATFWTDWFSEEPTGEVISGSNFAKLVQPNSVVVGAQCRGSDCDDMRLLMQPLTADTDKALKNGDAFIRMSQCKMLPKTISEEGKADSDTRAWYSGFFLRRVGCSGRYCDNLRTEWCQVGQASWLYVSPSKPTGTVVH